MTRPNMDHPSEQASPAIGHPGVRAALEIIDLYFAPWGAAKAARWEALTNDSPFDAETALKLVGEKLRAPGGV